MSLMDLLMRGTAAQRAKTTTSQSRNAAVHDSFDRHVLADVKRDSPMWAEQFDHSIAVPDGIPYDGARDVYDDVWMSLHHLGDAGVLPAGEVLPSRQLGRTALEELQRRPEFQQIKARARGNPTMASVAFGAMTEKLREAFDDAALRNHAERAEQMAEQEHRAQDAQDAIDQLRDEAKQAADNGEPVNPDLPQQMRDAINDRQQARDKLKQLIDAADVAPDPAATMGPAIAQAARAGAKAGEAWGDLASLDAPTLKSARPDEAIALMEAWAQIPNFQEFIKLIGRSIRQWRALDARKVVGGNDEIVGIEIGNDLSRVLPTELMQLGHPTLKRKFMRQYVDEELLQFQTQGIDKSADGAGVMLLDMSGSMRNNARFLRALAMTLGFVKLMHGKRRDAIVFPFNGSTKTPTTFRHGQPLDMKALMALASLRPTGGTDIHAAVLEGERAIGRLPEFRKADIVVLTDGQYAFNEQRDAPVKARLAEAGIRTHGVAIDHTPAPTGFLLQFCDDAIRADALTTAAGHLVNAVA